MPYLTFHDGSAVRRVELARKLTGIGSADDNGVQVKDPAVLAFHCQVLRDGKNWVISSLDREALILVNGKERRHYKLEDGDLIFIGGTELVFSTEAPPAAQNDTLSRPRIAAIPMTIGGRDPRFDKLVRFSEKLLLGMEVPDVFKTLLDAVISLKCMP